MNILILGAGTIGLAYGWLLGGHHNITYLVKPESTGRYANGTTLTAKDLRAPGGPATSTQYCPVTTTQIDKPYDAAFVTVSRLHLQSALPRLAPLAGSTPILLLLNHWDAPAEATPILGAGNYFLGFPGQIGGGRTEEGHAFTIFPEGTRLEAAAGPLFGPLFAAAGLAPSIQKDMPGWLRVHYLQQATTAGALLRAGSYEALAADTAAVRTMVRAFREGLRVCRALGVNTRRTQPGPLFSLPLPLVTRAMQGMLQAEDTREMVTRHMGHGLPEWAAGWREVLATGRALGIPMPVWESYEKEINRVFPQISS